jgi:hypothetical protein
MQTLEDSGLRAVPASGAPASFRSGAVRATRTAGADGEFWVLSE